MSNPTTDATAQTPLSDGKGWRRAGALFVLVLATSIIPAGMLVSVPLLVLVALTGIRSVSLFGVTLLAMVLTMSGTRDPLWYVERGWAVILAGIFAGLTLLRPGWRLTTRALATVASTTLVVGSFVLLRAGAWSSLEWSVSDRLQSGVATWFDIMAIARDGQAVPPALATAVYRTIELQTAVFPAMVALQSMAALGVAWWLYARLVHRADDGLVSVAGFRFNDHLVWLMILALVLVVSGSDATRLGANLAVFMGALYALRGTGGGGFVSGGLSLVGYTMFTMGILFAAPVVIGFMLMLGMADTWLDLRARAGSPAI